MAGGRLKRVKATQRVLSDNDLAAAALRQRFAEAGVLVLNLLSSPGSGKTSLLERTAAALGATVRMAVIEGDLQTERDAERVRGAGVQAVQINTDGGCHLSAEMVAGVLSQFDLGALDVLFIENVGNLVCPACFDLGEDAAVLLFSVTEGDDKPGKYPTAFLKADVVVVNKTDLIPYTNFDLERFRQDMGKIKSRLPLLTVSCTAGAGLEEWYAWLQERGRAKKGRRP
jgi:hydrogenase nickel incorporation protein HypB